MSVDETLKWLREFVNEAHRRSFHHHIDTRGALAHLETVEREIAHLRKELETEREHSAQMRLSLTNTDKQYNRLRAALEEARSVMVHAKDFLKSYIALGKDRDASVARSLCHNGIQKIDAALSGKPCEKSGCPDCKEGMKNDVAKAMKGLRERFSHCCDDTTEACVRCRQSYNHLETVEWELRARRRLFDATKWLVDARVKEIVHLQSVLKKARAGLIEGALHNDILNSIDNELRKDKKVARSVSDQKKSPLPTPYPQGTRYGLVKRSNLKRRM